MPKEELASIPSPEENKPQIYLDPKSTKKIFGNKVPALGDLVTLPGSFKVVSLNANSWEGENETTVSLEYEPMKIDDNEEVNLEEVENVD